MKKKVFFSCLVALAIIAMAGWNVNFGSKTNGMLDVMLANVEALAQNEDDMPPSGSCGWYGATMTPCLIDWSGTCSSCASFWSTSCPYSAYYAWCRD